MNFNEIEKLVIGKKLPLVGENESGETVIVSGGVNEIGKYYKTETAQNNGWMRVNIYYENGTYEETYDK